MDEINLRHLTVMTNSNGKQKRLNKAHSKLKKEDAQTRMEKDAEIEAQNKKFEWVDDGSKEAEEASAANPEPGRPTDGRYDSIIQQANHFAAKLSDGGMVADTTPVETANPTKHALSKKKHAKKQAAQKHTRQYEEELDKMLDDFENTEDHEKESD